MSLTLPAPSGPLGVEISSLQLTDYSRPNPWAAEPPHRSIMVSTFTPVGSQTNCNMSSIPYMPTAVAEYYDETYSAYGIPNGTFTSISQPNCDLTARSVVQGASDYPVLLFLSGLGNSRFLYSALASQISSFGLTVITIDHPYDAAIVQLADGSTVTSVDISTKLQIVKALGVRTKDISFFVSELLDPQQHILPYRHDTKPPTIMIAGHSLGGATAAEALLSIPQLKAGANLDGSFWGQATKETTTWSKPFLLFGHANKIETDPTWASIVPRLLGAKAYVELHDAADGSFTDLPYLVELLGLADKLPKAVSKLLGTIDGYDAFRAVSDIVVAWFKDVCGTGGTGSVRQVRKVARKDPHLTFVSI
ncbi:hypothetical protein LTR09_002431 [Extremus antarcticus]|uniref:1-alkyl-2-acetylglycerophosphocholine esterase n=1 Tax=Extremus antarcticus TaxID=702011 RepID=A0AAJ0GFU1_9PEZI|nr:hypothetical protein LTR09_002431 [Extremus antarcticus]